MKKEKGITLITLVITIIVILIIAGVAIAIAKNGGLFDNVEKTSETTTKDEEIKVIKSAYTEMQMNKGVKYNDEITIGLNKESLNVYLQKYANGNDIKIEEATDSDKETLETVVKAQSARYTIVKVTFSNTNNSYLVEIEIDANNTTGTNPGGNSGTTPGGNDDENQTVFEYNITYNPNGGTLKTGKALPTYKKKSNKSLELLFNIDDYMYKEGYRFKGWAENATDTEPLYKNEKDSRYYTKNENKELYAVWKDEKAPTVTILNTKSDSIEFKATDDGSGIYSYILKDSQTMPNANEFLNKGVTGQKEANDVVTRLKQETTYYIFAIDVAGNISEAVSARTLKVPDKTNITLSGSPSTWTNKDVTVTSTVKQEILNSGYMVQMSLDGINYENISTMERSSNGLVYARLVDKSGNVGSDATYNVNNIDKDLPTAQISASAAETEANISFNITARDELSGIQRIEWHYKEVSASSYNSDDETYTNMNGSIAGASSKNKNGILYLKPSTTYNIYAMVYDVAGNSGPSDVIICTTPNTIYVTLYTDGTLAFNNVPGTIAGRTVQAGTWNITGQKYHPAADSQTANNIPWLGYASSVKSTQVINTIIPDSMGMWFYNCTNLTNVSTTIRTSIDTKNVESIGYMYYGCSSLTTAQIPAITNSKLKYMTYVFAGCGKLNNIAYDSATLNTNLVTQMRGMFQNCSSLTSLNFITRFSSTSNVQYFEMMFDGCSRLTTINLSNFNTSNAIWMQAMFRGCSKLTTPTNIKAFKTDKVTNMQEMFSGCSSLTSLNCYNDSDSSCWNTRNVTNMNYMFQNCSNLATINRRAGNWSTKATTTGMFNGCKATGFTNK